MVPSIAICVAFRVKDFGIGCAGQLPWPRLTHDMRALKSRTMGHGVIMGRKTYESLPDALRPLPGRTTVVLSASDVYNEVSKSSKSSNGRVHHVKSMPDLERFLEDSSDITTWFVLGGAALYRHFMHPDAKFRASSVYATLVTMPPATIQPSTIGCDTFFPGHLLADYSIETASPTDVFCVDDIKYHFVKYALRQECSTAAAASDEEKYLGLMHDILTHGEQRVDRTGTGTLAVFAKQLQFDLRDKTIPMITTRMTSFKVLTAELLWFLRGSTNTRELHDANVKIWDANTSRAFLDQRGLTHLPEGDMGPGYGFQWRHFGAQYSTSAADYAGQGVDQLEAIVAQLQNDTMSRRICMTAWNPADLDRMALPPCHSCFVQFFVHNDGGLSCHMYQRSVDTFLGLALNIPSYALLTHILAFKCGLHARSLTISTGDTHVYMNHIEQVREQLGRRPMPAPKLLLDPAVKTKAWHELSPSDFTLLGYTPHAPIRAVMAV